MRYPYPALWTLALLAVSAAGHSEEPTGTNIIGSQEAPTVLNVVPWKDREVRLERNDPTSALLNRVLDPLDQEVLLREVEYHRQFSRQNDDNDGLFLD